MSKEKICEAKQKLKELAAILKDLTDEDIGQLWNFDTIHNFLKAILDISEINKYDTYADFFSANKFRGFVIAMVRHIITKGYSIPFEKGTKRIYLSLFHQQWFNDGVLFLEGDKPFSGFLGLYRNQKLRYGILARDKRLGDEVGPKDFNFITIKDFNKGLKDLRSRHKADLESPIAELNELFDNHEEDEILYQEFFKKYPWVLGLQYSQIQSHKKLDNENIPDFTGVRISDGYRDIIEIKSPFIKLFRQDGAFHSRFNEAWNQVEKYLNFATQEKDYLRRKGLNFDNPKCYLIIGFNIPDDRLKKIRMKERLNPAITVLTYNNILTFAKSSIEFVKIYKDRKRK